MYCFGLSFLLFHSHLRLFWLLFPFLSKTPIHSSAKFAIRFDTSHTFLCNCMYSFPSFSPLLLHSSHFHPFFHFLYDSTMLVPKLYQDIVFATESSFTICRSALYLFPCYLTYPSNHSYLFFSVSVVILLAFIFSNHSYCSRFPLSFNSCWYLILSLFIHYSTLSLLFLPLVLSLSQYSVCFFFIKAFLLLRRFLPHSCCNKYSSPPLSPPLPPSFIPPPFTLH